MNQGKFGSCCGYAFTRCMVEGIANKYHVHINWDGFLNVLTALCPCWEGQFPERMANEFNAKIGGNTDIFFQDTDSTKRYRLRVGSMRTITSAHECYDVVTQYRQVLPLLGAIKTGDCRHANHAVMLDSPYDSKPQMRGINSWGTNNSVIRVTTTPGNGEFMYALFIDPEIIEVKGPKNASITPPRPSKEYDEAVARGQGGSNEPEKKKKRPRDDNAQIGGEASPPQSPLTVKKDKGKHGFIEAKTAAGKTRERAAKKQRKGEGDDDEDWANENFAAMIDK